MNEEIKSVGMVRAQEAIGYLERIPKNDKLRARAFQIVEDWIGDNDSNEPEDQKARIEEPDASAVVETRKQHEPARVTVEDREHRKSFRAFAISESEEAWRPVMSRLYGLWDEWARELFEAEMIPPYILLASTSRPQSYGDYSEVSGFGGHSQIRIRRTLLTGTHPAVRADKQFAEGRERFVSDVLLHEMVHQYQSEILGDADDSYSGHGPNFRDVANRIGAKLGLPPVRIAKARGKDKDLPSCAQWPHCVRPADYYLGALAGRKEVKQKNNDQIAISIASPREAVKAIIEAAGVDFMLAMAAEADAMADDLLADEFEIGAARTA